ncbi:MAG: hypothetical protein HQK83_03685 [Fibrobacteria bacterium]|nr:hypothetical protein [Fibrobacteria bacterium]
MKKENLIKSAKALSVPGQKAASEYLSKHSVLVAGVNKILSDREDLLQLIGEGNVGMMLDNHNNHALFLESLFTKYEPEVLVETVTWVFSAYRNHGFHDTYWAAQLNAWLKVLEAELTKESFTEIKPFYDWLIINIPAFATLCKTSNS